jgi:hypothetical protein
MIKARFLRSTAVDALRSQIKDNLYAYRSGEFSHLAVDPSCYFELSITIDDDHLKQMNLPKGEGAKFQLYEAENCIIITNALKSLSPYDARDERLWTYLTHTYLLEYSRRRWPIPDDDEKAISHIQKHFFARDKRQMERDNSASRLWWMGHLCNRAAGLDFETALNAFLYKSDVRANIIERPTSSQSINIFSAILKKLSLSLSGDKQLFERQVFRRLMTYINSVGGFKLLDFLDEQAADQLLDSIIKDKMQIQKI